MQNMLKLQAFDGRWITFVKQVLD